MKISFAILLSSLTLAAFAAERGINYDPAHSVEFTNAQNNLNIDTMRSIMQRDILTIHAAGFANVKTFFSSFATIDGKQSLNAADVVCSSQLGLYMGVYEFNPDSDKCDSWCEEATRIQVQNAIKSANKYPNCARMIIIGNEDIYNSNFTQPNKNMQQRIATDIQTIKNGIYNKSIVVTSAQQDGAWLKLARDDPYGILGNIDTIAVNIYPFWSPQEPAFEPAKTEFMNRLNVMETTFPGKTIVVTEEGWPSNHSSQQNANGTMEQAKDYYAWWQSRAGTDKFSSFYFTMYDKQPSNPDADNYFGLCAYNSAAKIISHCED